ncbi:GAF and ANTAR domain-containing protein [Actinomycetospora chlora]|uniref:GAF and ANTAR domain-containing protein n=1 Tax=Actinomycetospora chlora TaxID=663608 RepID=A0ABP9B3M5_9PSEU
MSRRRSALRAVMDHDPIDPSSVVDDATPPWACPDRPDADPLGCLVEALDPPASGPRGERAPDAWVAALLAGAVDATPGADLGSVTEFGTEQARTWAATLPVAEELDHRGAAWDEGPGADARGRRTPPGTVSITAIDETAARRWPRWSARARVAGVGATLTVVLPGGPRKRPVVLALHGPEVSSFGQPSALVARTFAGPLAVAVQAASRVSGLERALGSRDVIGQAKGVLMARHGLDDRAAFEQLVDISQRSNVRLADVAARLVAGPEAGSHQAGQHLPGGDSNR